MMVHGGDARDEDPADIFDILEAERCLRKLTIRYLTVNHLIDRFGHRCFGEVIEAA